MMTAPNPPPLDLLLSFAEKDFIFPLDDIKIRAPRDRPPERIPPVGRVSLTSFTDIRPHPAFVNSGLIIGPVTDVVLADFRSALDTNVPRLCSRHFTPGSDQVLKRRGDVVHYFDGIWVVRGHNGQRLIVHQQSGNPCVFTPLAFFQDGAVGHLNYRGVLDRLEECWYLLKES
jgi:hypothetical protein